MRNNTDQNNLKDPSDQLQLEALLQLYAGVQLLCPKQK